MVSQVVYLRVFPEKNNSLQMTVAIPFNKSSQQGKELDYIKNTISNGQVAGDQTFSKKCQSLLEDTLGVQKSFNYHIMHTCFGNGCYPVEYSAE